MSQPETPQEELVLINSIDDFAFFVANWHQNRMKQLIQASQVPDDVQIVAVLEEGQEEISLTPEQVQGFRAGLILAKSLFEELPFTVTPDPIQETVNDKPH